MSIYESISAVQADLAKVGVGKDGTNQFDKYQYRSIDALLNTLSPILAKHGVVIMPSVVERETNKVPTQRGGEQFHTILKVEYTLYGKEGDHITHAAMGEAMDRGDKSINKALTAAFKYFLFQAFCIPLQGEPDADDETHEIAVKPITTEQFAELLKLCEDTNTEPADFAKWISNGGTDVLNAIPATHYEGALAALNKKKAKLYEAEQKASQQSIDEQGGES